MLAATLAQSAGTAWHAPHADAEAVIHLLQKALPLATRQELAQRDNCTRQQFLGQWDESGRLLLALLKSPVCLAAFAFCLVRCDSLVALNKLNPLAQNQSGTIM